MFGLDDFFRQLAEDYPRWNFIWMYEPRQSQRTRFVWTVKKTTALASCQGVSNNV